MDHAFGFGTSHQGQDLPHVTLAGFQLGHLQGSGVLPGAECIVQRAQDGQGVQLAGGDQGLLNIVVDGALGGDQQSRTDGDPIGAQGQGGQQPATVGDAPGGQDGHIQEVGGAGYQSQGRKTKLADVTTPFCAKDGHGIHAGLLGAEGVAHADALVHGLDASGFQTGQQFLWRAVAAGLDHRHALLQDHLEVELVVDGPQRREEAQVDAKGLAGQGFNLADRLAERLLSLEHGRGHHAQGASVGDGGDKCGSRDVHHTTADDGVFCAK